jgi:hypothetical protein
MLFAACGWCNLLPLLKACMLNKVQKVKINLQLSCGRGCLSVRKHGNERSKSGPSALRSGHEDQRGILLLKRDIC